MADQTLIADLARAGLDPELLQRVVLELARATAQNEAIEARRQNDRDRQARRRHVTSREVTECHATSGDVDLQKDGPHTPKKNYSQVSPENPDGFSAPKGAKTTRKPRNRALPTEWQPGERSDRVRAELGRNVNWMRRTAAAMRTWAESKGEVRADWDATHEGWMRREAERECERGAGRPQQRAGPAAKPSSHGALSRVADLLSVPNGQSSDPTEFADHGPLIDHEGDGRYDREVHEPTGGQAGRFSPQAALRLVGAGRH
ncbi:hypothetical protein [Methylobacterium sp. Leaf118]|uniref:hypothetical protein n=1 Tax=Methylobacterium sp. Leaf118 TaxID=2876562 RepID=UPI001E56A831|nr:hypothetical protein [Methylobacterium sp. Leaf118]